MNIGKLAQSDVKKVAALHRNYLSDGFLANLGQKFLEKFYSAVLTQKNIFIFAAREDNKIVGFLCGATQTSTMPKIMFEKLWKELLTIILKNPLVLIKLMQIPFYPGFKPKKDTGEILTIALLPEYRGRGIGKKLILESKKEFRQNYYHHFFISVRDNMKEANNFYRKIGLKKVKSKKFLGEVINFWQGSC